MCGTFGDVYLQETVVSHIRRLLDKHFASTQLNEPFLASSPEQLRKQEFQSDSPSPGLEILLLANAAFERLMFRRRLTKVEQHMNSVAFTDLKGGDGLPGLARRLRTRCETLIVMKGERLPK